MVSQSDEWYR